MNTADLAIICVAAVLISDRLAMYSLLSRRFRISTEAAPKKPEEPKAEPPVAAIPAADGDAKTSPMGLTA